MLALNPAGKSSIKVKNGSNIEIKHVLSGGYLYNKTYYVQVIIDSETYYLVELFDVNNKTFQVSEIDKDEYGNAINNRMKEAYNRPYIIEKNQFNGCENFVLK